MAPAIRFGGLWEMLLTYARAFTITAASVEFARGQIHGLMAAGNFEQIGPESPVTASINQGLELLKSLCADIPSLNTVCHDIDRISAKIEHGVMPLVLYTLLESLQNRVMDELRHHYYYPITAANNELYHNPAPFGEAVFDAFPSARSDITHATQCAMFGQSTAAVFHCMRVMEVALKVLGRRIGIAYAPSWEAYLGQISAWVSKPHKEKTMAFKRKQSLLLDISGDLTAVKFAWRNPTMHVVRNYDANEALSVLMAVSHFMNRLASNGFKESGKPVAKRIVEEEKQIA